MDNLLQPLAIWTFASPCSVPNVVQDLLVEEEKVVCAYKTIRDVAIFTNKRLIVRDAQGLTGKKIEIYTLPYSSIVMYSTENAGIIDFNAEVELWTKAGHIKINLGRGVNIREIDKVLATYIL
jgi:hypothetical protein